jgi:hypothetical protein
VELVRAELGMADDRTTDDSKVLAGWKFDRVPLDDLLHAYADQCERSRVVLRNNALDTLERWAPPGLPLVTLRWIASHMIEETARHVGHLDILWELIDGACGY